MTLGEDLSFTIEGRDGTIRVVISTALLKTLAGRSHVSASEVLSIHRSDFEDVALAKARRQGSSRVIRLESSDM